jgi:hypothetical protein
MTPLPDLAWRVAGVGDLNGDRRADVLTMPKAARPRLARRRVHGREHRPAPPLADLAWTVADVADFDGSKCDVLWRHRQLGDNRLWMMDGLSLVRDACLPMPDLDWRVGWPPT